MEGGSCGTHEFRSSASHFFLGSLGVPCLGDPETLKPSLEGSPFEGAPTVDDRNPASPYIHTYVLHYQNPYTFGI